MSFDTIITVDWSGGNDRGASPKADAIWTCVARDSAAKQPQYHRNRQHAEEWLTDTVATEVAAGRSALVAFDLCFAYPAGFARALTGTDDPFAVWDWFAESVEDGAKSNNRFDLAGQINQQFGGIGPFWGNALARDIPHLPRKGTARTFRDLPEKRATDAAAKGAFSPWQLSGAGAVGGQVIMGLPTLARLRNRFGTDLCVWPFQKADAPITLVETYFSLMPNALAARMTEGAIKDAEQTALFAQTFANLTPDDWQALLDVPATEEGWVLGLGHEALLESRASQQLKPPPLRNDCFAMPQGAYWTPVDDALDHLRTHLKPVCGVTDVALDQAAGRILAAPVIAARSHPPAPNAAVDGYAFAGAKPAGPHQLPLVTGRAAAGQPYDGTVPEGHAVRILTGASLPAGADTVILQEDVTTDGRQVAFHGPLKQGANARKAGEDMQAGQTVLSARHRLTPADLAKVAATGVGRVTVYKPLRVGVLSTGDELVTAGDTATADQIFDANRPMLCATVAAWGYEVVDLGKAPDNQDALRPILDDASVQCDAILTSGGASAGDEDHISALLQGTGSFALWRMAIKPGRPLALGLWQGTPVFGLPGNPVAAQVCALVFARPALSVLAGGNWLNPQEFAVPAGFTKAKKDGRREYLRARITDGVVEVFASEGSGRVSGLSWATGLVVLPDHAVTVNKGDLVTFVPFASFGL
ncbi:molybdenum cofactor synthesis domain-containing protein [Yoonia sp. 208BN28-4]|uniref:molybdenum cofactor synthesis domain-containing protein n=1 Tax=Yoonia sp. 208BN28-4 TaxID=3126505 RepID=UPI0030A3A021